MCVCVCARACVCTYQVLVCVCVRACVYILSACVFVCARARAFEMPTRGSTTAFTISGSAPCTIPVALHIRHTCVLSVCVCVRVCVCACELSVSPRLASYVPRSCYMRTTHFLQHLARTHTHTAHATCVCIHKCSTDACDTFLAMTVCTCRAYQAACRADGVQGSALLAFRLLCVHASMCVCVCVCVCVRACVRVHTDMYVQVLASVTCILYASMQACL